MFLGKMNQLQDLIGNALMGKALDYYKKELVKYRVYGHRKNQKVITGPEDLKIFFGGEGMITH
jgi:hypothetical protein